MRHVVTGPRPDMQEAREQDNLAKAKMKREKDSHRNVKENNIQQGDLVLLRRKSTKHESRYDPEPYLAVQVQGSHIVGERGRYQKTRDAQRLKRFEGNTWDLTERRAPREDPDIGASTQINEQDPSQVEPLPDTPGAEETQPEPDNPRRPPRDHGVLADTPPNNSLSNRRPRKEMDYRKLHRGDWGPADGEYSPRHRRRGK